MVSSDCNSGGLIFTIIDEVLHVLVYSIDIERKIKLVSPLLELVSTGDFISATFSIGLEFTSASIRESATMEPDKPSSY
jgi:hypothetical protein